MKKAKARAVLVDGKAYQRKADGTLVPLKGKTDWKRLDRQISAQVEDIAARDREGAPMSDAEWARAEIVRPEKVAVGIKLDSDVLDWFKDQGKGYQSRINGVLRRYFDVHQTSSGQDGRHRDQSGEIRQKHGDTSVGMLRDRDGRLRPQARKAGSQAKAIKRK